MANHTKAGQTAITPRQYESFLLERIRRLHSIYSAGIWVFRLLVLASLVAIGVALSMHVSIAMALAGLPLTIGFFIASHLSRGMAYTYESAMTEMDYGIRHPKYRLPDEYSDDTLKIRLEAAKALQKKSRNSEFADRLQATVESDGKK